MNNTPDPVVYAGQIFELTVSPYEFRGDHYHYVPHVPVTIVDIVGTDADTIMVVDENTIVTDERWEEIGKNRYRLRR